MKNNIRFHRTSNLTEAKFTVTIIHVKNSNIYFKNYPGDLILLNKLLLKWTKKKSKTNVNYNNRVKIIYINSNSNSFTNLIKLFIFCLFIYSLIFKNSPHLFLCSYPAIKSHLWFKRLPGSKSNKNCIFSFRRKLHLPSKQLGIVGFFNILHWISGVKPIFFNLQKCLDKAVCFIKHTCENEWIWLLYLNIHLTDVIPI